jgi:hypothetical protein
MLPGWQNQIIRVREAFGREMIQDESQPEEEGVIFVKSADESPRDQTYERIMCHTFGDDPTEYRVRMHGGDTTATIREGLKRLHPGKNPEVMTFESGVTDDDAQMSDWLSTTGEFPPGSQI